MGEENEKEVIQDKPRAVCILLSEKETKVFDQITSQLPVSEQSLAHLKFYQPQKFEKLCEVFGICRDSDKIDEVVS